MKHWIKISILSILTVLVAVIVYFSFYMLSYSLDADNDRVAKIHKVYERVIKENPELKPWIDSLNRCQALRDTFIIMKNGERQHATFIYGWRHTGNTAILIHGYKTVKLVF